MKKLLFSMTAFVCSTALFAQTEAKVAPATTTTTTTTTQMAQPAAAQPAQTGKKAVDVAKFESEAIDLGKIKQDVPATATFIVTNISKEPLIIDQANPTCGCTISDYTKTPIAPGKTGTIKATYNAKNAGAFDKHLTVKFAGVDDVTSIGIKGDVLTAEEYTKLNPGSSDTKTVSAPATETKTTTTAVKTTTAKKPVTVKKTANTTSKTTTTTTSPKS